MSVSDRSAVETDKDGVGRTSDCWVSAMTSWLSGGRDDDDVFENPPRTTRAAGHPAVDGELAAVLPPPIPTAFSEDESDDRPRCCVDGVLFGADRLGALYSGCS